jgi:hypothetical protein
MAKTPKKPKKIKVVHAVHPGLHPPRPMTLEVRECATLGDHFADVYLNGVLFARELSRTVAETFVKQPLAYPNAFIDAEKLRTWLLEKGDQEALRFIEMRDGKGEA